MMEVMDARKKINDDANKYNILFMKRPINALHHEKCRSHDLIS